MLNLLIKPVSLFLEMIVQDQVGHQQWGIYATIFSFSFLFTVFSDLGVTQYFTNQVASNSKKAITLLPFLNGFKIITLIFYPLFLVAMGLITYSASSDYTFYIFLIGLTTAIIQFSAFYRGVFQGHQMFKVDAISSNLEKLIFIVVLFLLIQYGISLEDFIIGRLIAVLIAFVLLTLILIRSGKFNWPQFNFQKTKPIIRKSIPFALITILYSFNEKVDQVMLERLHSQEETGLYSAAYRWLDLTMMYLWIVLPMFFAKFSYHKITTDDKNKLISFGTTLTAIPMIFIGVFVWFNGELLFFKFNNSTLIEIGKMTSAARTLFICLIVHGFFAILSTYLTSNGFTRFVNKMLIISILINIISNFVFIPIYGATAAAYTTLVSTAFTSITYIIFILFKCPVQLPVFIWGKLLLVLLTNIGSFYFIRTYFEFHWTVETIFSGMIPLSLVVGLKIINIKALKHL